MEGFVTPPLNATDAVMKRKPRSVPSRKPRPKEQLASEYKDLSSCAPSQSNSRSISPDDEDAGVEGGTRRKEFYLNDPHVSMSPSKKVRREDRVGGEFDRHGRGSNKSRGDVRRSSEGVLALASARSSGHHEGYGGRDVHMSGEGPSSLADNKLRKVKLKIGGVTRTIHGKSSLEAGEGGVPGPADASLQRHKHKGDHSRGSGHGHLIEGKHHGGSSSESLRKSRRVPKRRTLDGDLDEDEDGELRYLEKLKVAKVVPTHNVVYADAMEDGGKKRKLCKVRNRSEPYEIDEDFMVSRSRDNRRRSKLGDGGHFIEEEEPVSDGGLEAKKKKQKEVDVPAEARIEPLTTRQRALQGKGGNGESVIEFPDGLPPASSRKQKDKLSEMEIQAKKAEAAQRRKMQVEKQNKEAEAEAIRKILGLDSDKKKEEKKQKEREEKEKAAKSQIYTGSTVRWDMGPSGTIVTFPGDIGLPNIFDSKPCSYPPPREKCAGPSCTNPYKYRDSKSKLPLCSLECYRAVQGSAQTLTC